MKAYDKIPIWDFPATKIFVRLKPSFRERLLKDFIRITGSQLKAMTFLSHKAEKYNISMFPSPGNLHSWIQGTKIYRCATKTVNIPLWALIEISLLLSKSSKQDNFIMRQIEKNIEYYMSRGAANHIYRPKLPISVTPEMVSVLFHLCGDGHLSDGRAMSSYRQMNRLGLNNFLNKLKSIFGEFEYGEAELENGKINIPKAMADIYKYYFQITNLRTFTARIPEEVKRLPKDFLLAGLTAFILDDGHVSDVIEIYSKNFLLLKDIKEITLKLGYSCRPIRKKYRYGKFDSYRFLICSENHVKLYEDLLNLTKKFPHFFHK